jgi:hypothetical protein
MWVNMRLNPLEMLEIRPKRRSTYYNMRVPAYLDPFAAFFPGGYTEQKKRRKTCCKSLINTQVFDEKAMERVVASKRHFRDRFLLSGSKNIQVAVGERLYGTSAQIIHLESQLSKASLPVLTE